LADLYVEKWGNWKYVVLGNVNQQQDICLNLNTQ